MFDVRFVLSLSFRRLPFLLEYADFWTPPSCPVFIPSAPSQYQSGPGTPLDRPMYDPHAHPPKYLPLISNQSQERSNQRKEAF